MKDHFAQSWIISKVSALIRSGLKNERWKMFFPTRILIAVPETESQFATNELKWPLIPRPHPYSTSSKGYFTAVIGYPLIWSCSWIYWVVWWNVWSYGIIFFWSCGFGLWAQLDQVPMIGKFVSKIHFVGLKNPKTVVPIATCSFNWIFIFAIRNVQLRLFYRNKSKCSKYNYYTLLLYTGCWEYLEQKMKYILAPLYLLATYQKKKCVKNFCNF